LLHNQGGRFKIISTIGHVLLFMNQFMPSVLIAIQIFLGSMANLRFVNQCFTTVWHQRDVWHPSYASLCAIGTILTPFYLQTNASNEE
jgi:hypothetical protein